jgi:hypothetical protein
MNYPWATKKPGKTHQIPIFKNNKGVNGVE